jgi:DNA-binding NtrC family response regulator
MLKKQLSNIFIVDDERVIAETLATILKQSGFSARFFTNPLEALIAALSDAPDLLITDVTMPQFSGVDLAIRMTEQCPKCKILLFSGQAGTVDLLLAARAQGYNFHLLAKPIHPTDLLRHIEEQGVAKATAADAAFSLGIDRSQSDACLRYRVLTPAAILKRTS